VAIAKPRGDDEQEEGEADAGDQGGDVMPYRQRPSLPDWPVPGNRSGAPPCSPGVDLTAPPKGQSPNDKYLAQART